MSTSTSQLQTGEEETSEQQSVGISRDEESQHDECQYLQAIRRILQYGNLREDRTKVGTWSLFGMQMRFRLNDGKTFPLFTTKRVFFRGVIEELLWFIRGSTNTKELSEKNVHIWDANSSREFLNKQGLHHHEEGDLGPVYGFQWRHFGAEYKDMHADYSGQGVDQLAYVIDKIKNNPCDRRIVMVAWNAKDIRNMALPPCHCLAQFYVASGKLSCLVYLRAADMGLGVPFNIASYAFLTCMVAHVTNLQADELVFTSGDTHVYCNHKEALLKQVERQPRPFPRMIIKRRVDDINDFRVEDFAIEDYHPYPKIAMDMAV